MVNQYVVHILSPVTDNFPSSIKARGKMTVENISQSIFMSYVSELGFKFATARSAVTHTSDYAMEPGRDQTIATDKALFSSKKC